MPGVAKHVNQQQALMTIEKDSPNFLELKTNSNIRFINIGYFYWIDRDGGFLRYRFRRENMKRKKV